MKISFCFSLFLFLMLGSAFSIKCKDKIEIPAEWDKHRGTFMVFPSSAKIWHGSENLYLVRRDIVRIAKAIADYEKVTMLVDPSQVEDADYELNGARNIKLLPVPVDDLWARDTFPVFGYRGPKKELVGVDFNFNGWGNKQEHTKDSKVARTILTKYNIPRVETVLVGEGGSFETDGEGTLFVTESSILNENRNPTFKNKTNSNRDGIEAELKRVLGMKKVIWFDGVYGKDITDAHVDCLVRFVKPGVVILNRSFPGTVDVWSKASDQAKQVLDKETDAKGRKFKIYEMFEPDPKKINKIGDEFLSSYVNFYIADGAIIMSKFGDKKADAEAQRILQEIYPNRDIVPVRMDDLASGGGGIHCSTHEMPCYTETAEGIKVEC